MQPSSLIISLFAFMATTVTAATCRTSSQTVGCNFVSGGYSCKNDFSCPSGQFVGATEQISFDCLVSKSSCTYNVRVPLYLYLCQELTAVE